MMEHSSQAIPTMKNLAVALIKAKDSFSPILKTKLNPFFKSKYADLEDVLDAITPALSANNLVIVQPTSIREDGRIILQTLLIHESGESLESQMLLPDNNDPQKLASSMTLLRRHSIVSLLALACEVDDDGNAAQPGKGNSGSAGGRPPSSPPPASPSTADVLAVTRNKQIKELYESLHLTQVEVGQLIKDNFRNKVGEMSVDEYTRLLGLIKKLAEINKERDANYEASAAA